MYYFKNDETDFTATFGSNVCPEGWSTPTQEEIDAYLLQQAKNDKLATLRSDLYNFEMLGIVYNNWTFDLHMIGVENVEMVNEAPLSMEDRYKYFDKGKTQRDFSNESGFSAFKDAVVVERNRIMVKLNGYEASIQAASTIAEINAITIDFSA